MKYHLAEVLEKQGRTEEAIRYFRAARTIRPESAHKLAHLLENRGETDEAIAVFQDLSRLRPDNHNHLFCLENALRERGLKKEADAAAEALIAVMGSAVSKDPRDAYSHFVLGQALNDKGQLDQAIAEFRLAARIQPGWSLPHSYLGSALHDQGKFDEAVVEDRTAVGLSPSEASTHTNLGDALRHLGKLDEAIAECRTAIRLKPDYFGAHNNLGLALHDRGKPDEAIAECRTAIRLKPDNAGIHNGLAWYLALTPDRPPRDYDEAAAHARKAVELNSKDSNSRGTLALAEYRRGRWNKSVAASERSMALKNGGDAYSWFLLALVLWQQGHRERSRSFFDQAVTWTRKNDPKNAELLQFWREAAVPLGLPGPVQPPAKALAIPDKPFAP